MAEHVDPQKKAKGRGKLAQLVIAMTASIVPPHMRKGGQPAHSRVVPRDANAATPKEASPSVTLVAHANTTTLSPASVVSPRSKAYDAATSALHGARSPTGVSSTLPARSWRESHLHSAHTPERAGQVSGSPRTRVSHAELLPPGSATALEPFPLPVHASRLPSAMLPSLMRQQDDLQARLLTRLKHGAVQDALERVGIQEEHVRSDEELAEIVDAAVEEAFEGWAGSPVDDPFLDALAERIARGVLRAEQRREKEARQARRRSGVRRAGPPVLDTVVVEAESTSSVVGGGGGEGAEDGFEVEGESRVSGDERGLGSSTASVSGFPDLAALAAIVSELQQGGGVGAGSPPPAPSLVQRMTGDPAHVSALTSMPLASAGGKEEAPARQQTTVSVTLPPPDGGEEGVAQSSTSNRFASQAAVELAAKVLSPPSLPPDARRGRLPAAGGFR